MSQSIDETITILLSREVTDALYLFLQKVHSISKDEVPHKLETLSATLEKTFGVAGSRTITKAIARNLYSKLGLPFSNDFGRTLLEYIEAAEVKLSERETLRPGVGFVPGAEG